MEQEREFAMAIANSLTAERVWQMFVYSRLRWRRCFFVFLRDYIKESSCERIFLEFRMTRGKVISILDNSYQKIVIKKKNPQYSPA